MASGAKTVTLMERRVASSGKVLLPRHQTIARRRAATMIEQGQVVRFSITSDISGVGRVCGLSTIELPVIGCGYIIEIISAENIDRVTYPYTHMVVFQNQITELCPATKQNSA